MGMPEFQFQDLKDRVGKGVKSRAFALETDRAEHIEAFLTKSLRMREETGIIPDLRGPRKVIGWWFPSRTKNVLVEIGDDGSLIPKLLDVNFISGEHLGIQYAHPFFHTKAIRRLLESLG